MGTNYYKDCKSRLKAMGVEYPYPIHPGTKSGVNGVAYKANRACWAATITFNGKTKFLGYFKEFEDAVRARLKAEEIYGRPEVSSKKEKNSKCSGTYFVDLCGRC